MMGAIFGLDLSLGSLCAAVEHVSQALKPLIEAVRRHFCEEKVVNGDETGWRCNGKRRYLWAFVSPQVVFFEIAASRGSKVLASIWVRPPPAPWGVMTTPLTASTTGKESGSCAGHTSFESPKV